RNPSNLNNERLVRSIIVRCEYECASFQFRTVADPENTSGTRGWGVAGVGCCSAPEALSADVAHFRDSWLSPFRSRLPYLRVLGFSPAEFGRICSEFFRASGYSLVCLGRTLAFC